MGRLKHSRCYLAGPMDRCPDGGKQWREDLVPFLQKLGVEVWNPLDKPIDIGVENLENRKLREELKTNKRWDELSNNMKIIRHVDLRMVDNCDFMIVNWDLDISVCGTAEEVFWANRQKQPTIVHCPQGKSKVPDWLFGVLPHEMFFGDWYGVKLYLKHVDEVEDVETYKRWVFFDYEKLRLIPLRLR